MTTIRRLPIYLLLDCSESMVGEAIEQVDLGVRAMVRELQGDPGAIETAWLSVITFSRYAKQEVPLTELMQFQPPRLQIRPGTALGSALQLLSQSIQRDVRKTTAQSKGDYRPIVFLFTDGQPTDPWQPAAQQLRTDGGAKPANIYAVGCGPDVDTDVLRSFADVVLNLKQMSPEGWRKTFVWLTASLQSTSVALQGGGEGQPLVLPDLPADALELASASRGLRDPRPRQVFLYSWCARDKRPYLMRFVRNEHEDFYQARAAHPLDEVESWSGDEIPPVHSSQLVGVPTCPYCSNPTAAMCPCGTVSCAPADPMAVLVCPNCRVPGTAGATPDGFDIRGAEG